MDPQVIAPTTELLSTPPASIPPENIEPEIAMKPDAQRTTMNLAMIAFKGQRKSDRYSVGSYVQRAIDRDRKQENMTSKDKWTSVLKWWEEGTAQRERDGRGSVRLNFKDQYDEADEHQWLEKRFARYLAEPMPNRFLDTVRRLVEEEGMCARRNEDQDDEERPLDGKTRLKIEPPGLRQWHEDRKLKLKPNSKRNLRPNYAESDDRSTSAAESEDEDGPQASRPRKKTKVTELQACSRDLGIVTGATDAENVENEALNHAAEHSTSELIARRRWTWIRGELKVWPPFPVGKQYDGDAEAEDVMEE